MRETITKELLETLLEQGLSTNAIAKQLGYTGAGVRYHMKKHGLVSLHASIQDKTKTPIINGQKMCSYCNEMKDIDLFHSRPNGNLQAYCKKCAYRATIGKPQETKIILVQEYGGKCSICGYNKNLAALEFHHKDPSEKEFSLGHAKTTNLAKLRIELDKCLLLCSNCHKELHYPHYQNRNQ